MGPGTALLPVIGATAVGAVVGSFVGVVADRWPRGEDFVAGRSRCRGCGAVLAGCDLVPVASFVLLRGRCRRCRAAIPLDALVAELAGGAIGALAAWSGGSVAAMVCLAVYGWALLLLALLDARHFWLPDAVTLPLGLAGLGAGLILPGPTLVERGLGAALGFGLMETVRIGYRRMRGRAGLGGGDAKLMGALGAWLGVMALPAVLLGAALAGLAGVGLVMLAGGKVGTTTRLPLGVALAAAGIVAVPFVYG